MKEVYIHAASSITRQNTFSRSGFALELMDLPKIEGQLQEPIYKEYIPAALLRRTPKINKMALACTADCLQQYPVSELDAIITGTGLGCMKDTEKFLDIMIHTPEGSMISPTAFIQSGHNAVAGQIALLHKNRNYNMTHVQGGLSFEHALLDSMISIREGKENVLLGAGDEHIELLGILAKKFSLEEEFIGELSEGASYFIVGGQTSEAKVLDVSIARSNWESELQAMLNRYGISNSDISMAFLGYNLSSQRVDLPFQHFEYTKSCGRYFSSSAFGFHLATDYLKSTNGDKVLVINFADNEQVGLTLLSCD